MCGVGSSFPSTLSLGTDVIRSEGPTIFLPLQLTARYFYVTDNPESYTLVDNRSAVDALIHFVYTKGRRVDFVTLSN